ncbi:hypothetical protein C8Q80DRAFT_1275519 [Daedaleopsis nitida]|nr:hypothetical protein C8Q80DRAFT_1275519 [Daedaleopsis nitida]
MGLDADAIHFRSSFPGEASSVVYFKQKVNGVPVANAVANVAFNNANKIASSFTIAKRTALPTPSDTVGRGEAAQRQVANEETGAAKAS